MKPINYFNRVTDVPYIIGSTLTIIKRCREDFSLDKSKSGGYLTIMQAKNGLIVLKSIVGQVCEDKALKYCVLSEEKAKRLFENLEKGHVSSFQSRDESAGKWSGAVLAGDYILSFSGMPEVIDEAMMLLLAVQLQLLSVDEAEKIFNLSSSLEKPGPFIVR